MNINTETIKEDSGNGMTAMVDIVFLLIIFFMVTAQISSSLLSPGIELPVADHANEDKGAGRLIINISNQGRLICNGINHSKEALQQRIRAYTQYTRRFSTAARTPEILIRADRYTPYGSIQYVMTMLQEADIAKINFAVRKVTK